MSPPSGRPPRSAWIAWIAVCLVWGTTYLAIRVAIETIPPFLMTGLRWVVAGAVIVVALKLRGERLPEIRQWPALTLLGILLLGFGNGCVVWAEQTLPSGLTSVLVAVVPFWMVGIERLMGDGQSMTRRRIIGLAIGFAGIVLLVWPDIGAGSSRAFLWGVLATQLACLGWAIGSSYSRRRRAEENVLAAAAMQMLLGGGLILVLSAVHGEWAAPLVVSGRSAIALGYLTIVGSIAGFSAYVYALKYLPVATVSLYAYVNPVIAVLLGTALLDEPLSPRLAMSAAIVLAGMAMVRDNKPSISDGR
jgi:drug/metabolite transporter (DMT)-like permease